MSSSRIDPFNNGRLWGALRFRINLEEDYNIFQSPSVCGQRFYVWIGSRTRTAVIAITAATGYPANVLYQRQHVEQQLWVSWRVFRSEGEREGRIKWRMWENLNGTLQGNFIIHVGLFSGHNPFRNVTVGE